MSVFEKIDTVTTLSRNVDTISLKIHRIYMSTRKKEIWPQRGDRASEYVNRTNELYKLDALVQSRNSDRMIYYYNDFPVSVVRIRFAVRLTNARAGGLFAEAFVKRLRATVCNEMSHRRADLAGLKSP